MTMTLRERLLDDKAGSDAGDTATLTDTVEVDTEASISNMMRKDTSMNNLMAHAESSGAEPRVTFRREPTILQNHAQKYLLSDGALGEDGSGPGTRTQTMESEGSSNMNLENYKMVQSQSREDMNKVLSQSAQMMKVPSNWERFKTVCFRRDQQLDEMREIHDYMAHEDSWGGWGLYSPSMFELCSWLIPALIGILTATAGAWIEVMLNFLSSMRYGRCPKGIFLERAKCFSYLPVPGVDSEPDDNINGGVRSDWQTWNQFLFGAAEETFLAHSIDWGAYVALSCFYGSLACAMCLYFAPRAVGSGIPEAKVILSGFHIPLQLSSRTLVVKIFALALVVGAGLATGKEGPIVHIACCFAQLCSKLHPRFKENEAKKRELISAACAAGVSVAFGAPVGGVLFSYEEASTFFPKRTMNRAFLASVIAAISLQWWNPTGTGELTLFEVKFGKSLNSLNVFEYGGFLLLGVFGGLAGAAFCHINARIKSFRTSAAWTSRVNPLIEVACLTLMTAVLNYPAAFLRDLEPGVVHRLFNGCENLNKLVPKFDKEDPLQLCDMERGESRADSALVMSLTIAFVVRFFQWCLTFGASIPCGLFVPSLFCGALAGRLVGIGIKNINMAIQFSDSSIEPGAYALVGAAALLGGVCRVTISLVVIMFELTGALHYIIPFMLSIQVSVWIADYFTEGIYDAYIMLAGYPYLWDLEDGALSSYVGKAKDIMEQNVKVVNIDDRNTVKSLQDGVRRYHAYAGFPVVRNSKSGDGTHIFLGYVHREDMERAIAKVKDDPTAYGSGKATRMKKSVFFTDEDRTAGALDWRDLIDNEIIRMVSESSLSQVHNVFRQLGVRTLVIVDRGRLKGLITKKGFVSAIMDGTIGHPRTKKESQKGKH